jgi:hypothetical protein
VGAGNGYVLAVDAQALEAAIIAAQTAKSSATNNQQLAEAVAALNEAVAAFQEKIKEGKDHEVAEGVAACSTTCKHCNVVGMVGKASHSFDGAIGAYSKHLLQKVTYQFQIFFDDFSHNKISFSSLVS